MQICLIPIGNIERHNFGHFIRVKRHDPVAYGGIQRFPGFYYEEQFIFPAYGTLPRVYRRNAGYDINARSAFTMDKVLGDPLRNLIGRYGTVDDDIIIHDLIFPLLDAGYKDAGQLHADRLVHRQLFEYILIA